MDFMDNSVHIWHPLLSVFWDNAVQIVNQKHRRVPVQVLSIQSNDQ